MGLTEHESELQSIEMYCDEHKSSLNDGDDPGEFSLENFNNWLDSQGEGQFDGTDDEFLALVREAGYDPTTDEWIED